MPCASSCVLIGGYTLASEPVTAVAEVAREDGHAGHEGAADTEDVQAHYGLGSSGGSRNGPVTASDSST